MRYLFPLSPYNQQRQFEKPVWVYPAHLAMYATYLRNQGHEVVWGEEEKDWNYGENVVVTDGFYKGQEGVIESFRGDGWREYIKYTIRLSDGTLLKNIFSDCLATKFDKIIKDDFQIEIPFTELPYPDRAFTDAKNPRWQSYGNYKFHSATHMMASNLCWWGKCTFCVDTLKLEQGEPQQTRSVAHVMEEIDDLIANGYAEVFDDSGTFPIGKWLEEFCTEMRKHNRNKKICVGINMKPLHLDYRMMKEAGFRFILVGVESVNQETLDRIKKGQHQINVEKNLKAMAEAGLEPHLTSMFGYDWESHEDAMRTVKFIHRMLKKGYVKTAQASVYSPPRTAPDPHSKGHKYIPMIYDVYKSPEFWFRKISDIRRFEDFTYLLRGGRLVVEEKIRKLFI